MAGFILKVFLINHDSVLVICDSYIVIVRIISSSCRPKSDIFQCPDLIHCKHKHLSTVHHNTNTRTVALQHNMVLPAAEFLRTWKDFRKCLIKANRHCILIY